MTDSSSHADSGSPTNFRRHREYQRYKPLGLVDRTWPDRVPEKPPIWCSVDLRDGNQALIDPMDPARKRRMFDLLLKLGFTEIEVGFPMSSRFDLEFTRSIIESDAIPDGVIIQVMSQCRDDMIEETVKAVHGAPDAILQVFNPLSPTQRRVVFGMSRAEIKSLARHGAETALRLRDSLPGTRIHLQYGAESFTQTEPEFAAEVCNAVLALWQPTVGEPARISLPATVECYPPHEFADRIEWMHRNLMYREAVVLTLHTHNDRGCGVAATELALLAGADRVEGTLFGNGERAGNVCLITLAMNLFSQGIDPGIDLSNLDEARAIVEQCNRLPVSVRHPWVGDFAYTAFAGAHQDAIAKSLRALDDSGSLGWDVPYLPIDPCDVGRDYQALIRINQQSGKGGIAYLLRTDHGYDLPLPMQIEFAAMVQATAVQDKEITSADLLRWFIQEYLGGDDPVDPVPGERAQIALEELLRPDGIRADVRETHFQRAEPDARSWIAYIEIATGPTTRWGAGAGSTQEESLGRALRSAGRRLKEALV